MALQTGRGQARPDALQIGSNVSPSLPQINREADQSGAIGRFAEMASAFSGRMLDMAGEAAQREGQSAARTAVLTDLTPQDEGTLRGQAFNRVAEERLSADRRTAMLTQIGALAVDHPDDPGALGSALQAMREGFGRTSFEAVNQDLDSFFALHAGTAINSAREGRVRADREIARGAFVSDLSVEATGAAQVATAVDLSESGATAVGFALDRVADRLARYGPREAFDFGGRHFEADPNRQAAMTPAELARAFDDVAGDTRSSWIRNTGERLTTADTRAGFEAEVRRRYADGDPAFAGMSAERMDGVLSHLGSLTNQAETEERAATARGDQHVRDLIEAYRWGDEHVSAEDLDRAAASTSDAGLRAQASFLAHTDRAVPGVLNDVVHRQRYGSLEAVPEAVATPEDFEALVTALTRRESAFDPRALSNRGAAGLMQLIPGTARAAARRLGVALEGDDAQVTARLRDDPALNVRLGREELRHLLGRSGNNVTLALAAYNAGEGAVFDGYTDRGGRHHEPWIRSIGDPRNGQITDAEFASRVPFTETRNYIAAIGAGLRGGRGRMAPEVGSPVPGGTAEDQPTITRVWDGTGNYAPASPQAAAFSNAREGFATDPLNFVRRHGQANITPLALDGAFADGEAGGAWVAAVRSRSATGEAVSSRYQVPPRILTNAEVTVYRQQLAADPTRGPQLAARAVQALGPERGAAFMREVANGGDDARLAGTAVYGAVLGVSDPEFGGQVAQGIVLRQGAGRLEERTQRDLREIAARFRPNYRAAPEALQTATDAAEAAALSAQAQGRPLGREELETLMLRSLGSRTRGNGHRYGGPTTVNGAATVAPDWLDPSQFGAVIRIAAEADWSRHADGPVWSDGRRMTADEIARLQPVAGPGGRYRLALAGSDGRQVARRPNGQVFEFNVNNPATRTFMAQRLPPRSVWFVD